MPIYTKKLFKLSSALLVLLGVNGFNVTKALALDLSQIPIIGPSLQKGIPIQPTIEPNLRVLDQGLNRNYIQVCLLTCQPPELTPNLLGLPIGSGSPPPNLPAPGSLPPAPSPAPMMGTVSGMPGMNVPGGVPQQLMPQLPLQLPQQR